MFRNYAVPHHRSLSDIFFRRSGTRGGASPGLLGFRKTRPFGLAILAILLAPVAAWAQVDERCEVLMPGTELTRSAVSGPPTNCQLQCFFKREFCVDGVCTPTSDGFISFPVDDCAAEPIIRQLDGVPRNQLDAELKAALDNLEARTIVDTIAIHELPATDIGRVKRLADNGRGELTANLYARVLDIALASERTVEEQLIAEAFANEWHNLRIESLELAKAEFDAWSLSPCTYVPPEGFTYDPDPSGTLCTGNFTLVQLFTMVTPPSLAEFIAYGQVLSGLSLQDPETALATAKVARALQFTAGAGVAFQISAAIVSAILVTANLVFPFTAAGTALAATLGALGAGIFLGAFAIIFVGMLILVMQAINVFNAADIGPSLEAALEASQTRPLLVEVLEDDRGKQEFFTAFLKTTLPGVDTSGQPVPDTIDDWFLVTDADDGNPVELETLPFLGWLGDEDEGDEEQDPFGWTVRLKNGWFIVKKDLSSIPEAGIDHIAGQTLAIEYLGWNDNPLTVREMFAWRTGSQFFILPKGGDPDTDGYFSDALRFMDPAACDPECNPAERDPRRIATILSDDTPPVITPNPSGTLGANDWYTSDVNIAWSVSDPDSEILDTVPAGCPDVPVIVDGITEASCAATSRGGTAEENVSVKRDASPPSISGAIDPPPNAAGWHNGASVDVNFTCGDFAPSGQDDFAVGGGCGPNATVTDESASPAGTDVTGTATDLAGNTATATVTVMLDRTPPEITGSASPEPNDAGWNNENVTVSFECEDDLSGVFLCANNLVINTEGADQSLSGDAQDFAGNENSTLVNGINIDFTPPSIVGSASPAANAVGWINTEVTVHFDCSDALSGIDFCTPDTVLSGGAGQSQDGIARDRAGNENGDRISGINVDLTPPVVTVVNPPNTLPEYLLNEIVPADWSASDALSGLAGATGSAANGDSVDTTEAGEWVFEVQADDVAGNHTTVQHRYIVLSPAEAVAQTENSVQLLVDGGVLKKNQANGLLLPLANAVRSIEQDKIDAACAQLDDFIDEVNAKTPKPIDPETAAALIAEAEDIAAISLQCR